MAVLPAAAPLPLREALLGPRRDADVVGAHPSCLYLLVGDDVVAVESADALGLPCALRLGIDAAAGPFTAVRPGQPGSIGTGRVTAGPLTAQVVRWWSPPVVRAPHPGSYAVTVPLLADLLHRVPAPVDLGLAPPELLGRGPGLTPAGDDVLAGMLLATHHAPGRPAALDQAVADAAAATTSLSATLLRHAAAGRGVPAAVAVADALAGHHPAGALSPALDRLLRVGHTSGAALAHGLLAGARLVSSRGEMSVPAPGTHQSAGSAAAVPA